MQKYNFTSFDTVGTGEIGFRCTPFYPFWRIGEGMIDNSFPSDIVLASLMTAAVTGVVCVLLYRVRPSEKAGTAVAFHAAERVIKFLLVVPISLVCALFFYAVSEKSAAWGFFGWLAGLLLASAIIEFAYCMDIREVLRDRRQLLLTGAFTLGLLCLLQFDPFGYDTWLPKPEELEAIRSTSPYLTGESGIDVYVPNPAMAGAADDAVDASDAPYRMEAGETAYELAVTDTGDDTALYRRSTREHTYFVCTQEQMERMLSAIKKSNTFTGSDEDWQKVRITYQMKGGREKHRCYSYAHTENVFAPIWENQAQKKSMYPILNVAPDEIYAIRVGKHYSDFQFVSEDDAKALTSAQVENILQTFQKELLDASYQAFLWDDGWDKVDFVYRSLEGEMHGESFPLGKAFPETRKALRLCGFALTDGEP